MRSILIYGSATHHNTGDLGMMRGLIRWLQQHLPEHTVTLLTRNPELSSRLLGIPCYTSHDSSIMREGSGTPNRFVVILKGLRFVFWVILWRYISPSLLTRIAKPDIIQSIERMHDADAIIVHGSGSFNSIFWHGWLYPKAFTALAAHILNTPVYMTSQGIGPFTRAIDRFMARIFLNRCAFIGVRDGLASGNSAIENHAPASRVYCTGDDSLLLVPVDADVVDNIFKREGVPNDRILIGVNVRDASSYHPDFNEIPPDFLASILDDVVSKHHAHLVFIPITFDPLDDDRISAEKVKSFMKYPDRVTVLRGEYETEVLMGIIARMTIATGVSYHFLLFALHAAVPSIAMTSNTYYESKHLGLLSFFHQTTMRVDVRRDHKKELTYLIDHALGKRGDIANELTEQRSAISSECAKAYLALKNGLERLFIVKWGNCYKLS